jgi:hypothetical protein
MLTRIERSMVADIRRVHSRAEHFSVLEPAHAELARRVGLSLAACLWECPCGGWWVVPTPPPRDEQRCPRGARPPWEGDDR